MKSLLFVYNAKSDYWSKKIDFAHKIISPSTYNCDLCALTHGNFGETEIWKNFRETVDFKMDFIYKDEFKKLYPKTEVVFPIILKKNTDHLTPFIEAKGLAEIKTVEDLILKVKTDF